MLLGSDRSFTTAVYLLKTRIRRTLGIPVCTTAEGDPSQRSGDYMSALDGLIISGMAFQHAWGECVRIRSESTHLRV